MTFLCEEARFLSAAKAKFFLGKAVDHFSAGAWNEVGWGYGRWIPDGAFLLFALKGRATVATGEAKSVYSQARRNRWVGAGNAGGKGRCIDAGGRSRRPFGAESGALFCPRVALRSPVANGAAPVATVRRPFGAKNDRTHFRPPNNQSYPPAPLMHKLKVTGIERDTSVYIKPVSNSFQLSGPSFYFHPKAMNDAA